MTMAYSGLVATQMTVTVLGTQQSSAFFLPAGSEITVTCDTIGAVIVGGCTIDYTQSSRQAVFAGTASWVAGGLGAFTASSVRATKVAWDCFVRINGTGHGASVFVDPNGATVPSVIASYSTDTSGNVTGLVGPSGTGLALAGYAPQGLQYSPTYDATKAAANSSIIAALANSVAALGGGVISLPAQSIPLSVPLPLLSNVQYSGAGYTINGGSNLVSGTILIGNGTIPAFYYAGGTGNSTAAATYGDLASPLANQGLFQGYFITNTGAQNLAINNFTFGIKAGGLYAPSFWYSTFSNIYIINCTQWGVWMENFQYSTIHQISTFQNANGQMYAGSGTNMLFTGNTQFNRLYNSCSTSNGCGRGLAWVARDNSGVGSEMNDLQIFDVQSNGNTVLSTQSGTSALSTAVPVTDLSKLAVGMPVAFTTAPGGFVVGVTYFVLSVSGSSGAGTITLGNQPWWGSAIAASTAVAFTLVIQGWYQFEISKYDALSGNTYCSAIGANDIEVGGACRALISGLTGGILQFGVMGGTTSTTDICTRGVNALTLDACYNGIRLDLDNGSIVNFRGAGVTPIVPNNQWPTGVYASGLYLHGYARPEFQWDNADSVIKAGASICFKGNSYYNTSATIMPNTGNHVAFLGSTASQTLTLGAITSATVGANMTIINAASVSVTVAATGQNIVGVGASGASITLAANTCTQLVATDLSGGTYVWARVI